jgi:hypothetical protein
LPGEAACLDMELKVPWEGRGNEAGIEQRALRREDKDCISFFTFLRIPFSLVCVFLEGLSGFSDEEATVELRASPFHFLFRVGPVVFFSPLFFSFLFFFSKKKNPSGFDLRIKKKCSAGFIRQWKQKGGNLMHYKIFFI